ncbi:hypothetical protein CU669_13500 [Paramagnetospirillum kuznetsovii]|uniref:DUF2946 domain-containing protein n=2 Tax=Paramagnetospirillum kuznetsovii TaxID=2053833 RepID=A0A364NWK5_9PROT|nr:hypothetical protein CU669_13500 [Paramagnetospirillum kuznetsovii]
MIPGRIWRTAAAALLAVALCLGSIGDVMAGARALAGDPVFGGDICHTPRPGESKAAESDAPTPVHNCCVYCHVGQTVELAPPIPGLSPPTTPSVRIAYSPTQTDFSPGTAPGHNRARAPPLS